MDAGRPSLGTTLFVVSMVTATLLGAWLVQVSEGAHHHHHSSEKVRVEITTTYNGVTYEECCNYGKRGQLQALHYAIDGHHHHHNQSEQAHLGTCTVQVLGAQISGGGGAGRDNCPEKPQEDPCYPNPCQNSGICRPTGDNGHTCHCHSQNAGLNCEEVSCEHCYAFGDLFIDVDIINGSATWQESLDHCRSKGMSLLLDKDWDTHNLVSQILEDIHPDRSAKIAYWIGVKRQGPKAQFEYIDGTSLDSTFLPWAPDRPGGDDCVNIANGGQFNWKWDDDPCEGWQGWVYNHLCAKHEPSNSTSVRTSSGTPKPSLIKLVWKNVFKD